VNPRDAFFRLQSHDRARIQTLLSALAVLHIIEFGIARPIGLGVTAGIIGNLVLLFWCLFPQKALNWFFTLIPYICVMSIVFDGFAVFRAVSDRAMLQPSAVLSLARLGLLIFLAPAVLRHQRALSTRRRSSEAV
jgi:hypothetical protein